MRTSTRKHSGAEEQTALIAGDVLSRFFSSTPLAHISYIIIAAQSKCKFSARRIRLRKRISRWTALADAAAAEDCFFYIQHADERVINPEFVSLLN